GGSPPGRALHLVPRLPRSRRSTPVPRGARSGRCAARSHPSLPGAAGGGSGPRTSAATRRGGRSSADGTVPTGLAAGETPPTGPARRSASPRHLAPLVRLNGSAGGTIGPPTGRFPAAMAIRTVVGETIERADTT